MAINGVDFTITPTTLCNNGSVEKYFTGSAPSGWSLGALGQGNETGLTYTVDVTNNSGTPLTNVPITFAYPFAVGDMSQAQEFVAQIASESDLAVQTDRKALHADNSLRHAVMTTIVPSLAAGQTKTLTLATGSVPSGSTITATDVSAANLGVTVDLDIGGTVYTATLQDEAATPTETWLSGPIASEFIYDVPLMNGGSEHSYLKCRMYVRYYSTGQAKVDVVVENNQTFTAGLSNQTYTASIKVGGSTVWSFTDLIHYQRARWKETIWIGAEPDIHIAHNAQTLIDTKAVPSYDPTLIGNIDQTQYGAKTYDSVVAVTGGNNGNYSPMGIGTAEAYMPNTGGRRDIGPLPDWNAAWLLQQDANTRDFALEMADTSGSWSIHYRDENTGLPVSIVDYPTLSSHVSSGNQPEACSGSCSTPYTPDGAHQPQFSYLPYLLTGDFFHLEELQFWSAYNVLKIPADAAYRNGDDGLIYGQWREKAWSLRTLGWAAYITPDSHALKADLTSWVNENMNDFVAEYLTPSDVNTFGAPYPYGSYPEGQLSTWQDDFFTWSVTNLVDLGFTSAQPVATFKTKYPIQRMGVGTNFCYLHASEYLLQVESGGNFVADMDTVFSGTFPSLTGYTCGDANYLSTSGLSAGEMIGYSHLPSGYPSNMQPALAGAVNIGATGADTAWTTFDNRSVKPDYTDYPNWAIVPRSN